MSITATLFALAAAVSVLSSERYDDCIALVETDTDRGRAAAQQWADEGGGANAQHCLALADIAAGFAKLGAARLEQIAQRKDAGDDFIRARLLSQAANAWLVAGEVDLAQAAINAAFELAPGAGELYLTAAKVYAAQEKWLQVVAAVRTATQSGFVSAETYVLSARAHIALGDYVAAADDVVEALTLEPTNIDALVLRGEIQQTGVTIDVYYDDPPEKNGPGK
jgi:tetratricopeptide (TPR) repeat protein